jgi:hypothetical protein
VELQKLRAVRQANDAPTITTKEVAPGSLCFVQSETAMGPGPAGRGRGGRRRRAGSGRRRNGRRSSVTGAGERSARCL